MTSPGTTGWIAPPRPTAAPTSALRAGGSAALAAVALLVLAAWAALAVQAWRIGGDDPFLAALCQPSLGPATPGFAGFLQDVAFGTVLWAVMSTAMMLPTAVPMLVSHADARSRTSGPTASSAWVAVGYLGIWLAVSLVAALVQAAAARLAAGWTLPAGLTFVLAGGLMGAAGLYQFSALKQRCLAFCRHDITGAELSSSAAGTLRLGLRQGVGCLGCCGPVMALMLLAGFANLFWMAGFALLMTVEKWVQGPWVTRLLGAGLLSAGFLVAAAPSGLGTVFSAFGRLIAGGTP